jgi:hypothetical protein
VLSEVYGLKQPFNFLKVLSYEIQSIASVPDWVRTHD